MEELNRIVSWLERHSFKSIFIDEMLVFHMERLLNEECKGNIENFFTRLKGRNIGLVLLLSGYRGNNDDMINNFKILHA